VPRSRILLLLTLVLSTVGCGHETDEYVDDTSADRVGKADDVSAALISAAKTFAEGFDFEDAEHPTRVPREEQLATGPTWVRRAFALHIAWEDLDLGSARLYRWSVARHRVWAIRTSTDGDDSFIELFDAEGDWLATGTGGFGPDPGDPDEFVPLIFWDEVLGATREGIAPRDITEEVAAFWAAFEPLAANGEITIGDARAAGAALVAGLPTTESIDGHERAAVRRILADRALRVTGAARRYLDVAIGFYAGRFRPTATPTVPTIAAVLGLPAALAEEIRFSRVSLDPAAYGDAGASTMSLLAQRLGTLPSGALPGTAAQLAAALRAAGATTAQADLAIRRMGADDPAARVFAGGVFHISDDRRTVSDPGTSWFIATPAKGFVSFLHLEP
jgi:hypothetical protein